MKSGLLLNVVVIQSSSILQLFSGEDKALLIRWNALLILNLGLHVVDGIRRLNLQGDRLTRESLDKNLHATTEAKDQMEGRFLLNVVIRESTPILELLSGKNQALLIRGDSLFVLNLSLHIVDSIRRFDLEGDGFAGEGLDKDLHTTTEAEDYVVG